MPAKEVKVRELRAHLAEHLESEDPIIIRNHRRVVAVLLPTGLDHWPRREAIKDAMSRMKIMLDQDVHEVLRYL